MRLRTKLSLGILPIIAIAILGLGFWSVDAATTALENSAEIYMQHTLITFVENEIADRQEILKTHGLEAISSYLDKFQKEVVQEAATVQELISHTYKTAHIFALNRKGAVTLCLLENSDQNALSNDWTKEIEKVLTGKNYIQSHARIHGELFHYVAAYFEPWEWTIFLSISDDEFSGPAKRIKDATLWVAGISALTCIGFIFSFFNQFVVKPIRTLEQISLAMARREKVEMFPNMSNDELGDLAIRMEQVAFSLSTYEEKQISWQKELEKTVAERTKELRNTKNTLQTILDSMPFGVTLIDRNKRILSANQAALDLMGYEGETQVIGLDCHDTFCVSAGDCPILDHGQEMDRSDRYLRNRDHHKIPIIKSVVPVVLDGQQVLLEAFVDVSRQKKAEQALERSNQELNDFAYIASHDLKEPLRGIANYSAFLMEDYGDQLDEEGQAKLATLIKLCRREESLIDALLSYSRVGRTDLRIERQNIKKLVDEIVSSISHMTQKEGVMLRIDPALPDVACDRVWTGQVFYNLITNALKYNDKEEKIIEIGRLAPSETKAALPVELGDDPPVFFIRDNGIGIREKHLNKIFSIFKRLHGRDKFGGGTGAGLTIVERIILRHGGRIWVESDFGSGSTFYFTLERTQ